MKNGKSTWEMYALIDEQTNWHTNIHTDQISIC